VNLNGDNTLVIVARADAIRFRSTRYLDYLRTTTFEGVIFRQQERSQNIRKGNILSNMAEILERHKAFWNMEDVEKPLLKIGRYNSG